VNAGDRWERVVVENLDRTQLAMYAGASGDFHPLHHDEVFAREMGYPSVFAHGMLTMGLAGRLVEEVVGERLRRYGARMTAQVWPGATLTASVTVTGRRDDGDHEVADLDVRVVDQDGTEVLRGTAVAAVD
jgi:acyl dehydratase